MKMKPIAVECPRCGANAGEECVTPSGKSAASTHRARIEAAAEQPPEVRAAVVTKPDPPRPARPVVLGTPLPGPAVLGNLGTYSRVDRIRGIDPRLVGVVQDVWNVALQRPIRALAHRDAVVVALEDGRGRDLLGKTGHFERLRDLGGHPFGLAVLVMPHTGEPFLVLRWAYRHEGKPVLGQMCVARQSPAQEWTIHHRGNASKQAHSLRWLEVEV